MSVGELLDLWTMHLALVALMVGFWLLRTQHWLETVTCLDERVSALSEAGLDARTEAVAQAALAEASKVAESDNSTILVVMSLYLGFALAATAASGEGLTPHWLLVINISLSVAALVITAWVFHQRVEQARRDLRQAAQHLRQQYEEWASGPEVPEPT